MPKSQILKDLINKKIELSQALERILAIAMELNDFDTVSWVKKEKNGYSINDDIPQYRIIQSMATGTYQTVELGMIHTFKNHMLPTIGLPDEFRESIKKRKYTDGIAEILSQINLSKNNKETIGMPIPPELFSMFEEYTNIRISSAQLVYSPFDLENIIEAVRTRVIELLVLLEKNFGVLDDLDIDVNEYKENELIQMKEACNMIISGDYKGNVNIISNSKIKNSNIGNTNSLNKETHTEINPETKINFANKKSLIEKIIKLFRGKNNG